ncbi:PaaI family thioesterase [Delftia acidovorans]|uniref:Acyl-coenzyme A thioesterase THEM4 n=1 Tax=Delftia acidovorans TaxID=80866 RepID=A0AAJ2R571_DELAC|nr:PaaI family thioesterase [Delftia acidovorans]MDX4957801.1 PaaI family thioesterase [Delftia acidovorans]
MQSIQDHYPPQFAHCFGCGPANPHGLHLKSFLEGERTVARFTPEMKFSGGYPGNVYGGMLASLLDCHGTASAAAFAYRSQGRTMGDALPPIRFVTGSLAVSYKKPTPLGAELLIVGSLSSLEGRKAVISLELSAHGEVCVTGEMTAVQFMPRTS